MIKISCLFNGYEYNKTNSTRTNSLENIIIQCLTFSNFISEFFFLYSFVLFSSSSTFQVFLTLETYNNNNKKFPCSVIRRTKKKSLGQKLRFFFISFSYLNTLFRNLFTTERGKIVQFSAVFFSKIHFYFMIITGMSVSVGIGFILCYVVKLDSFDGYFFIFSNQFFSPFNRDCHFDLQDC